MATAPLREFPIETADRSPAVLVVDDDEQRLAATAATLRRQLDDAETTTLADPTAVVDALESAPYDCLISTFDMPGLDGIELAERVREAGFDLPFVLFPESGSEALASRAVSAGVDEYVRERGRGDAPALADRVRALLTTHRRERQIRLGATAAESTTAGIVLSDPHEPGDPIVYANQAFCMLSGHERPDLLGREAMLLHGDVTDDERAGRLREAAETGASAAVELRGRRADGSVFWDRVRVAPVTDGESTLSVWAHEDVTERHARTEQLEASRSRLEAVFELSPDLLLVHDEEGSILDANRRAREELGYEPTGLVGKPIWEVDATADAERAIPFWQALPADSPRRFEGRFRRTDGSTFPVEIHLIRLDIDGEKHFVAIGRDITERKAREEELVRQNERLSEFSQVVSHDLRNPLQVAQGRLGLLAEDVESAHLADLEGALDRMEALIDDLLILAREGEEAMDIEPVGVATVARHAWSTVETAAASLSVATDRRIAADRDQLRQLFENLFRNAVEHADPDCTVTVGELDDGFYVADDGPGIPTDERESVFEPGYSTARRGTGFGLNIVARVADDHGWTVDVTEGEAGGARFEIAGVAPD
ncbi:hypothetical protein JCM30237_12070 [Halolamina litorea]|uniref:histidine kinase n=1 Tax=Halolamina litorea TaxID=1515593 RepID=A0ABD6BN03_9EURY|nr:PAS domain S-box protein [Halolamina litorea]